MKKTIILTAISMAALTALSALLFRHTDADIFFTLFVTFGTTAYHFVMRLAVGYIVNAGMKNKADYTRKWYQLKPWEEKLYRFLKVKKWKGKIPTFTPEAFDVREKSLDEVAQAMCQAEVVHEVILLLSFLPIAAARWFGALPVFVVTSMLAAILELVCILAQRYNRPRILKIAERRKICDPEHPTG